jgi:hypothetical protein
MEAAISSSLSHPNVVQVRLLVLLAKQARGRLAVSMLVVIR